MPGLVLVVEDDERSLRLARDVLELSGFRVLTAGTVAEALELTLGHRPGLVLMDVHLPDGDGRTALIRLRGRAETAAIPVVALTAFAMRGDRERLLEAGFDDYLSKPVDVVALVDLARRRCRTGRESP